ncbi:Thioesterase superfamily [Aspergillus sclerotialis]|uniref:Thioesterase superfamily n=1 Tax=Aspergillus sclerotialis TaxID=2070753 RepID=A0A3A2ZH71_9EURO|nr:Thioesterase superfamily [Aspergillus sclerotialis]
MDRQDKQPNFIDLATKAPVDKESIQFFSNQPRMRPYLSESSPYQPIDFLSRRVEHNDTSNTFFNQAMNSPTTIPRLTALLHKDIVSMKPVPESRKGEDPVEPDIVIFVEIGSGLNGFRDTVHGGAISSLLDETLSYCVEGLRCCVGSDQQGEPPRLYTAKLNISFRAPVYSPGVFMVTAWLKERQGRKWFLDSRMTGDNGQVYAEAKGLWISEKPRAVI